MDLWRDTQKNPCLLGKPQVVTPESICWIKSSITREIDEKTNLLLFITSFFATRRLISVPNLLYTFHIESERKKESSGVHLSIFLSLTQ